MDGGLHGAEQPHLQAPGSIQTRLLVQEHLHGTALCYIGLALNGSSAGKTHLDSICHDVLKANRTEWTVLLPSLVAREVVMQEPLGILHAAVSHRYVARLVSDLEREVRIVGEKRKKRASSGARRSVRTGNTVCQRQRVSYRILARPVAPAALDKDAPTAKAKGAAGGIQRTTTNDDVFVVESSDAIVSRLHRAAGYLNAVAHANVYSVMAAKYRKVLEAKIRAILEKMRPVAGVHDRVSAEREIGRRMRRDSVYAPEMLLAYRVIAVAAVDCRARLANDAHVAGVQDAYYPLFHRLASLRMWSLVLRSFGLTHTTPGAKSSLGTGSSASFERMS